MLKSCRQNNQKVLESIKNGKIDAADISFSNFIDDIILKMSKMEIINSFEDVLEDKRCCKNSQIPLNILFVLAATAKMKIMTSLTDIPYAIIDSDTLAELGWNIYDTNRELEKGLISDGAIRGFLDHYVAEEFIALYNDYTRLTLKNLKHSPDIHILDCTKIEVNVDNDNYENSTVIKDDSKLRRGYKLASLKGSCGLFRCN